MKLKVKIFLLSLLSLALTQCTHKEDYTDDTIFGQKVMVLGHSGMGESYKMPRNTYESVIPVLGIGADGTEIDIQMTKDSVLVLFHDMVMDDCTNCAGRIYEKDWSEVKQCEYKGVPNNIYVYSAEDLLNKPVSWQYYYLSFDCSKVDNEVADKEAYRGQYLRAIKRLCEKYNITKNVLIEGDADLLIKAQQLGLTNKLFLFDQITAASIDLAVTNHFYGFSTTFEGLTAETVAMAHQKGLYVMTWSPNNDKQNKDALEIKSDIIQTDDAPSLLKLLDRYNYEYNIP